MIKLSNHEAQKGRRGSETAFADLPDPKGTPRIGPARGEDDRGDREERVFRWIARDHKGDADFIDTRNILTKTHAA
jgi:hypothetical protein